MGTESNFFLEGLLSPTSRRIVVPNSDPMIFLSIDSPYYTAGESVSGQILLNLPHNFPPGELIIESKGTEEVSIFDTENRLQQKNEALSEVFSFKSFLETWRDQIPAGEFVFPFSFKLPTYSPATFFLTSEDEKSNWIRAEIKYTITCVLLHTHESQPSLSHTRIYIVKNKNSRLRSDSSFQTTELVEGCCKVQGSTTIHLSTRNESHPEINGMLRYKLDPDNSNCRAPITNIVSTVILEVDFLLPSGSYRVCKFLSEIPRAT